jgi:peptidoglycan/xylan/chitin deacetylase (PgdA/CDA1 family)
MSRLAWLAGIATTCVLPLWLHAQSIAFTFDDGLDPRREPQARAWNDRMLAALADARVKAAFFPAGRNVDSAEGMALVESWGRQGHLLGNHTYSHRNLASERTTLEDFTADILRADQMYNALPGWQPRLRFPYLKEGNTAAKRDGMRQWMSQHGYSPAPVSVDTSDWYYSQRFVAWRDAHPGDDPAPFRDAYLAHLWDRARYYEGLSRTVIRRSPAHVMLLHTNAINAAFLPDVLAMFRDKGWKIVNADEAFRDPLYAATPAALPAGESIVWAIAKDAGSPGLRYPAEDDVYEIPILKARGLP